MKIILILFQPVFMAMQLFILYRYLEVRKAFLVKEKVTIPFRCTICKKEENSP